MDTRVKKSILAGIVATAVMTVIMFMAPLMGMPKMNPPRMFSGMIGLPIFMGWIMHFAVGIIFASLMLTFFCRGLSE